MNRFLPKPIDIKTISNSKEINSNLDKIDKPFQNLKKSREELFEQKMEWIKGLFRE